MLSCNLHHRRAPFFSTLAAAFIGVLALTPAAASAQADAVLAQAQREDLAVFRERFLSADRAYSPDARREAEQRLARLEREAGQVTPAAFRVEVCRIAALADNGHSQCAQIPADVLAPVVFSPFEGRFHVVGVHPGDEDLLGAELVSLDGRPVAEVRRVGRSLHGGVAAFRDLTVAEALRRPEQLHALGLTRSPSVAVYGLRRLDGRRVVKPVEAMAPRQADEGLVRAPLADKAPWALAEPARPFRWRDAPEMDALVVQLRRNLDTPDQKLADFLAAAEAERVRLGRRNVVLDMRFNGGGDLTRSVDFMNRWPARLPAEGRIVVLTGPRTFSAAIASIAYLEQAGGARVVLVGEPTGDRLEFFAEGRLMFLPGSGVALAPATERHDYRNGCRLYADCHVAVAQPGSPTGSPVETEALVLRRHPITVRSLDPDIKVSWTVADWVAGRDPAMAVAERLLRGEEG